VLLATNKEAPRIAGLNFKAFQKIVDMMLNNPHTLGTKKKRET